MFKKYWLLVFFICVGGHSHFVQAQESSPCVQIFYDKTIDASYASGKLYAIMVANLLGHFPRWQRFIEPIEMYQKSELDKCSVNFYIGSYYDNPWPAAFSEDFIKTRSKVVWLGYGFWKIPKFENLFGIQFSGILQADTEKKSADGIAGFYRYVDYKGVSFAKETPRDEKGILQGAEIAKIKLEGAESKELASIRHSVTDERIPWAIQTGTRYLFAENPLSYISEGDRYLVFADLLFDILQEQPQRVEKPAVIRLEDIHLFVNRERLRQAFGILKKAGATPVLSVIPSFKDPHGIYKAAHGVRKRKLNQDPDFTKLLLELQNQGGVLVWHGVSHQNELAETPAAKGVSGEDFEFWDNNSGAPIKGDSIAGVLSRLNEGAQIFNQVGLRPNIWITPHYKASALDYNVFGLMFDWTMGREIYACAHRVGFPSLEQLAKWPLRDQSPQAIQGRKVLFQNAKVVQESTEVIPQFFPYEIYGDYYGQQVLPENLGNAQPSLNLQVTHTRSVEQILADAKRARMLRDSWGSVFYHSYLLENEPLAAEKTSLYRLVNGLKELGFQFVDLRQWTGNRHRLQAPPIIDRDIENSRP